MKRFAPFAPSVPFIVVLLLSVIALALGGECWGQISTVGNDQGPPIPGAGHDYIHSLAETVNPANGSLSIRIQIPTPNGRQLTLPYAFAYDSNGVHYPIAGPNGWVYWNSVTAAGWVSTLPTMETVHATAYQAVGNFNYQCPYTTAYIFHDPKGSAHALNMSSWQPPTSQCQLMNTAPPNVLSGGDGLVKANSPSAVNYPGGGSPPVSVVDLDGTVYYFAGPDGGPSWVEDRNGNRINYSYTSSTLAETDTTGRAVLSESGLGTSNWTLTVSGFSNPYQLTWAGVPYNNLAIPFVKVGASICNTPGSGSGTEPNGLTVLTLPNGQSFHFYYEPNYGLLNEIVYPSGGWVKYTWGLNPQANIALFPDSRGNAQQCAYQYGQPVVTKRQVSFDGTNVAEEQDFTSYATTWNPSNATQWTAKSTQLTTYDDVRSSNFLTSYTYSSVNVGNNDPTSSSTFAPQVPVENQIVYHDWNGTVLQTVNEVWNNEFELASKATTLGSQTSKVTYSYLPYSVLEIEKDEYDYGQSTPTRKTVTNYATFPNTPIYPTGASILDRPCQTLVYDGSNNRVAETDYLYDNGTAVCGTAGTPSVSAVSGLPSGTHDETYYAATSSAPRGNLTAQTKQCFPGCVNATTTYAYYETGQIQSMMDPCGNTTCSDMTGTNHTTSYSYSDSYSSCGGSPPPSGNTNAYLTKVTAPLSHISSYCYGYNDGQVRGTTDPNLLQTTYAYADSLVRLTAVHYPNGGQTSISYNDAGPNPTVTTSKLIATGLSMTTVAVMDGVGHQVETESTSDPRGTVYTVTTYDGLGRQYTVTNPYRATSDSTYGVTTNQFDTLNRTTLVTKPDGSTVRTSYTGNCTTVTDEAGKNRQSCTDGLGRLKQVTEDPGGLNYLTTYSYNTFGNLTGVVQAGSHNRSFVYDSFARLTSSTNPEVGPVNGPPCPIAYSYDSENNLATKIAPKQNGGIGSNCTITVTTTYSYDVLDRLTGKTYTDPEDTAISYGYDGSACLGLSTCANIGHRTSMTDTGGSESFAYDTVNRKSVEQRTTSGITKTTSYAYDYEGDVASLTYPSGHTLNYTYNAMGQTTQAIDDANAYMQNGTYAPHGELVFRSVGVSANLNIVYNSRLQPCWVYAAILPDSFALSYPCNQSGVPTGSLLDLQYNYNLGAGDNGNIVGVTNRRNTNRSQTFGYDQLSRLLTAGTVSTCTSGCWSQTFGYDPWANLLTATATGTATPLNLTVNANNHITTARFAYDAAGNETADAAFGAYDWNAEGQLTNAGGSTYTYDGDGRRVVKSHETSLASVYWYGLDGNVLDETDATGSITNSAFNEYIYVNGQRIARRDYQKNAYYYFDDQVGSARSLAFVPTGTRTATLCYEGDFYPYGAESIVTNTCPQNYKWTGKERDAETGNDNFGARYYSSTYGRFLSADWSSVPVAVPYANLTNPQTLNLYAIVRDNPESYVDLDGHYELNASGCSDDTKCQKKWDKAAKQFETRREKDLKSKKADVRAAASNFGALGEANGVHVGFANLNTGANPTYGSVGASGSVGGMQLIQVTIDFGRAGNAETQTHEGTHVGDDQKFLSSYNPLAGGYDQSLNPTHGQTEFNAFRAGAEVNQEHGFGPNDTQKILNFLHDSPIYGPIFNVPVFDPNRFPAGIQ